jgi:hypothetical protein
MENVARRRDHGTFDPNSHAQNIDRTRPKGTYCTPFDYARREHFGEWMSFLQDNKKLIKRRVALVSSIDRIDIDCPITLCG